MLNIGCTLKELRELRGLTLKELANKSGFDSSYLSKIENSERSPTIESLQKICRGLDISLNTFFILADEEENEALRTLSVQMKEVVKKHLFS